MFSLIHIACFVASLGCPAQVDDPPSPAFSQQHCANLVRLGLTPDVLTAAGCSAIEAASVSTKVREAAATQGSILRPPAEAAPNASRFAVPTAAQRREAATRLAESRAATRQALDQLAAAVVNEVSPETIAKIALIRDNKRRAPNVPVQYLCETRSDTDIARMRRRTRATMPQEQASSQATAALAENLQPVSRVMIGRDW